MSVHPWTFEVLSFSQRVSEISSGIFDCTVGELLVEWGLLPNLKNAHVVEHSYSRYSFRDVTLLSNDTVIFSKPLTVDLGGIAKGFAVDKAVEHLVTSGITHGVVNAGGDIRAFGDREEPIHVRLPQDPHRLKPILMLSNRAIATSAPYFSKTLYKGAEISPLVDGITRLPYLFDESISVTAPTAMVADALTKVFINPMADLSLLKEFGATLFKTSQDGTVLTPYLTVAQ